MSTIVRVDGATKRYKHTTAVDSVSFTLEANRVYGLLGRNGAGKTTLMSLLTGQDFITSGKIDVFGASPVEHSHVLDHICFVRESQRYPDDFKAKHVFKIAPSFFPNWDANYAAQLVEQFHLPLRRQIKKLSRGQLSAVGVIVGLASRAPLTFFDEPYLGLDASARQLFYDSLLADIAERPRTIVLSTHLIDEVSNLLEHVLIMDQGKLIVNSDAEELRGSATTLVGPSTTVDAFLTGRQVLHREGIGGLSSVTVDRLDESERAAATAAGLEFAPVSLQQLFVQITGHNGSEESQ